MLILRARSKSKKLTAASTRPSASKSAHAVRAELSTLNAQTSVKLLPLLRSNLPPIDRSSRPSLSASTQQRLSARRAGSAIPLSVKAAPVFR